MKYVLLLKIKVDDYPYYIEIGNLEYNFLVKPSVGERIYIPDSEYIIDKITHDFNGNDYSISIYACLDEDYANFSYENKEVLIKSLISEYNDFIEYEGWYLSDYDLGDIKIPIKRT